MLRSTMYVTTPCGMLLASHAVGLGAQLEQRGVGVEVEDVFHEITVILMRAKRAENLLREEQSMR